MSSNTATKYLERLSEQHILSKEVIGKGIVIVLKRFLNKEILGLPFKRSHDLVIYYQNIRLHLSDVSSH